LPSGSCSRCRATSPASQSTHVVRSN
jgi:hypothetical protein